LNIEVLAYDDPVVAPVDAGGAGALVENDAALEEVLFEGGRDLGVLGGKDLLAADDQRHLRAE